MDSGTQDSLISTFGTLNPRVMVVGYDGNILSLDGPSVQGKDMQRLHRGRDKVM